MDIYMTADGQRLRIPLLPDRVNVKTGAIATSFQTVQGDEYKIPRGNALTGYSWNGIFPGESMAEMSFVHDWQQPTRIISTIKKWKEDKKIIRLMITEVGINDDVQIDNFNYDFFGAGNASYTLTMSQYKPVYISTAPPQPEVVIPIEQEPITTEPPKTPSSGGDNKKKNTSNKSNTSTDTQKKNLTVNIPTTKLIDVVKSGVKSVVSAASSIAQGLAKAITVNAGSSTKKVGSGGGGSATLERVNSSKNLTMLK